MHRDDEDHDEESGLEIFYTLTLYGYCGMPIPLVASDEHADMSDVRLAAARSIRRTRKKGRRVSIITRGGKWEYHEPEDCIMIPDSCGILSIGTVSKRVVYR